VTNVESLFTRKWNVTYIPNDAPFFGDSNGVGHVLKGIEQRPSSDDYQYILFDSGFGFAGVSSEEN
jgi:hypothetical protein